MHGTHRVTFYLNGEEQTVLEQALSESGKERADYFRDLLVGDSRVLRATLRTVLGLNRPRLCKFLKTHSQTPARARTGSNNCCCRRTRRWAS